MSNQVSLAVPGAGDVDLEVLYLGVFPNNQTSDVDDDQVDHWEKETGRRWPSGGVLEVPANADELSELDQVPAGSDFPYNKGGGFYVLSNGEVVRGKKNALEAESELQPEEIDTDADEDGETGGES